MKTSFIARAFFITLLSFTMPLAWSAETTALATASPSTIVTDSSAPASSQGTNTAAASSSATNVTAVSSSLPAPHCDAMTPPTSSPIALAGTPPCRRYCSVRVNGPYVAMSFDDGPSATLTPKLLDILKERGIKVTFFVIGENAVQHPEILARAAAEGHEIGNHTWDHPQLTKLSDVRVQEELNKTSDVIFQATGKKPTLLRPPYGAMNPRLCHMIEEQDGMKIILWSVDPLDWKRPGSQVVSQRILAGTKPGAIILSHDIHPGTVGAMAATLDALLAKGYKFVTVSELIAMEAKAPAASQAVGKSKHVKN